MRDILEALSRLVQREMSGDRGGDVMERAVALRKLGSGNTGNLTTSNTLTVANPLFPSAGGNPHGVLVGAPTGNVPFQIERLPPDVYTVQLSPLGLPRFQVGTNPLVLSTEATIVFSVDGRQSRRKVSVNQGVRVSGQADSIAISVRDNSSLIADAPNTVSYGIVIAVSRGERPAQQQPPTLIPVDALGFALTPFDMLLGPAASFSIPIDTAAGIISTNTTAIAVGIGGVLGGAITEGDVSVTYANNGVLLRAFDPRVAPWMPIVPGTNQVILANNTSAQTVQFSLVFGIDG